MLTGDPDRGGFATAWYLRGAVERDDSKENVTRLLRSLCAGEQVDGPLLRAVYENLRSLARVRLAKLPPGQTLQATALVNEAWLRLVGKESVSWENRKHFFLAAGRAMRDILVEEARRKQALKRGGAWRRLNVDDMALAMDTPPEELLALNEVLSRLQEQDERKAQMVHLRFFAGMTEPETAAVLGISERTLRREWSYVRARLHRELSNEADPS